MNAMRKYGLSAAVAIVSASLLGAGCGSSSENRAGSAGKNQPSAASTSASPATSTTTQSRPTKAAKTAPAPASAATADAKAKCQFVPATLLQQLRNHIILVGARLTKPRLVSSKETPGYYYLSTDVAGGGLRNQHIATWATNGLKPSSQIYSVDSMAAMISSYAGSVLKSESLGLGAPAAFRSRICVGGPNASPGVPAPPGGGTFARPG